MFRAGLIAVAAMFLIAAAPIQTLQPTHHRPEHSVEHPSDTDGEYGYPNGLLPPISVPPIYPSSAADNATKGAAYHSREHDDDSSIKWTDRAIVILTGGLVFAAILQVIAALLQWNAMNRQERQMRRSVIEARRASNRQSRDTRAAIKSSEDTAAQQASSTRAAISAANDQSAAAREANELSRMTLVAEQRPWISAKPFVANDLSWVNETLVVTIGFRVKNTGRTPAIHVLAYADFVVTGWESPSLRQRELVNNAVSQDALALGQGINLFPGDEDTLYISMSMPRQRIENYRDWRKSTNSGLLNFLPLSLVGCVAYRATVDGSIHKTAFHLGVAEQLEDFPVPHVLEINRDVTRDRVIVQYSVNDNYAD